MALTPISGEIISQTLNDNFSSLQTEVTEHKADIAYYVRDFGIVADGVADDTIPMQEMASYLKTNYSYGDKNNIYASIYSKIKLLFPQKSTIVIKGEIDMSFINSLSFEGNGSLIQYDGDLPNPMINLVGCSYLNMGDLKINGMGKSAEILKLHGTTATFEGSKKRITRNHFVNCSITNPASGYDVIKTSPDDDLSANCDESSFSSSYLSRGTTGGRLLGCVAEVTFYDCVFIHRGLGSTHAFESGNFNFFGCYFVSSQVDYWFGLNNATEQYQISVTGCNVESATKGIVGEVTNQTKFRGKAVFSNTQLNQDKSTNSEGIVYIPNAEYSVEIVSPILNETATNTDGQIYIPNGFALLQGVENGTNGNTSYYISSAKDRIELVKNKGTGLTFNLKQNGTTTFYVDAINGNDRNVGDFSNRLKTLDGALNRLGSIEKVKITLVAGTDISPNIYQLSNDYTMKYQHIEIDSIDEQTGQTLTVEERTKINNAVSSSKFYIPTGSFLDLKKVNVYIDIASIIEVIGGNLKIIRVEYGADSKYAATLRSGNVYMYYTIFSGNFTSCTGIYHRNGGEWMTGLACIAVFNITVDAGLTSFFKWNTNEGNLLISNVTA